MELYLNVNSPLHCVLHNRGQGGKQAYLASPFFRTGAVAWVRVMASCIGDESGVKICTCVLEWIGCMGVELGLSY
jgi:hypothetical protein